MLLCPVVSAFLFKRILKRLWNGTLRGCVNQAYSRLSTTHGHVTDCKFDSLVYAGVCVWVNVDLSCLGRTIYARQFLGATPPIQFRHSEQKWITQTIYTDSEPPSRMPNSLMPSAKLRSANFPVFTSLVWRGRTPASRTPRGRSNHCATQGRWNLEGRTHIKSSGAHLWACFYLNLWLSIVEVILFCRVDCPIHIDSGLELWTKRLFKYSGASSSAKVPYFRLVLICNCYWHIRRIVMRTHM